MDNIKILHNNNKVAIFNGNTSTWYRMPEPYYSKRILEKEDDFITNLFKNDLEIKSADKRIKSIYLAITRKCNLACYFCSMKSNPYVNTENEIDLEQFESIVLPKLEEINPQNIIISGGEPLVRDTFWDIIRLLSTKMKESNIILQTNGILLQEDIIKQLSGKISYIEISIENILENDNLFKNMVKIFDLLNKHSIKMQFSFVVDRNNIGFMTKALDLIDKMNASLLFRWVSPVGSALNNENKYLLEYDILKVYIDIIDHILEYNIENPNIISLVMRPLQYSDGCAANGRMLSIHPDGEISMCSGLHENSNFILGNILDLSVEKLLKLLETKKADETIQQYLCPEKMPLCSDCEIKGFCSGICASKVQGYYDVNILKADCLLRVILVKFWLFDFIKNKKTENLVTLRERIYEKMVR